MPHTGTRASAEPGPAQDVSKDRNLLAGCIARLLAHAWYDARHERAGPVPGAGATSQSGPPLPRQRQRKRNRNR